MANKLTQSEAEFLSYVKAGEMFTFRGYEYQAVSHAILSDVSIYIRANRREIGSNANFKCADILEFI